MEEVERILGLEDTQEPLVEVAVRPVVFDGSEESSAVEVVVGLVVPEEVESPLTSMVQACASPELLPLDQVSTLAVTRPLMTRHSSALTWLAV